MRACRWVSQSNLIDSSPPVDTHLLSIEAFDTPLHSSTLSNLSLCSLTNKPLNMTTLVPRAPYTEEELATLYPADLELQQVQVILRHGERTPVNSRFKNVCLVEYCVRLVLDFFY
jgi:hypothetical protein